MTYWLFVIFYLLFVIGGDQFRSDISRQHETRNFSPANNK
jgi:hypothetical protein